MSNISINPVPGQPIGTPADGVDGTGSNKPSPATTTTDTAATPAQTSDSVTLSAVAQTVASGPATAKQPLSESDAGKKSQQLRQQLGDAPLSGTARQNQAILALLR
jgi:hypothetical protein